jgi:hypothetical protein
VTLPPSSAVVRIGETGALAWADRPGIMIVATHGIVGLEVAPRAGGPGFEPRGGAAGSGGCPFPPAGAFARRPGLTGGAVGPPVGSDCSLALPTGV